MSAAPGTGLQFASPASTSVDELVGLRATALVQGARMRRRSGAPRAGASASQRLGRGLDFAEVREYRPGDDVRLIDWNVTARTQRPHTKLFVEERERPVHLCVDFRASMRFGTRGMYKSVLAARLAAVVGWQAVAGGERTGGAVLADERRLEVRPAPGRRGLLGLFAEIDRCQKLVPHTDGHRAPAFADALLRFARTVSSGATVWLFSDFAQLDERAATTLGGAFAAADLVLVHVIDPVDTKLPSGPLWVTGRTDRAVASARVALRPDARRRRREVFAARRARLESLAGRGRHALVTAETDAPFDETCRRTLRRDPVGPGGTGPDG